MSDTAVLYALLVLGATVGAGPAYIRVWRSRMAAAHTPTGFGIFLPLAVFGAAAVAGASLALQMALGIVLFGTAIYWLDDVIELSAKVRVILSLAVGAAIGAVFYFAAGGEGLTTLLILCLGAAAACAILTNVVNFYDGADLNLALYIALTAALLLLYAPPNAAWAAVGWACLAFVAAFSVFNSRPATLYLGDAGSFGFAGLLTTMGASFLLQPQSVPVEASLASALPGLDVLYVLILRLLARENLLTRHWLHLYHQLQKRCGRFVYLAPQIINLALCLAAVELLRSSLEPLPATVAAGAIATIPFYLACRTFLVPRGSAAAVPGRD